MEPTWRIELLGRFCLRRGEQEISHFRTRKTAALLAYLAYYPSRAYMRDELSELCWHEMDRDAARNALRIALNALRKQLEPAGVVPGTVVLADRTSVKLNSSLYTTDTMEFEAALHQAAKTADPVQKAAALEKAVNLYRGSLLPGFDAWWIASERQRLSDLYLGALRRLVRQMAEAHDYDLALDYARKAVLVDPVREESHRSMMRLYAALGQPRAVLKQYRELERILDTELAIGPSAATRQLFSQLTAPKPLPLDPVPAPAARPVHTVVRTHAKNAVPLLMTRFFGREEEIDTLTDLLLGQDVRLVTLTGAGGAGKTRLALETAGRIASTADISVKMAPLADLADPRLITRAVADALGVERSSSAPLIETVIAHLAERPCLLILDNLEHLLQASEQVEPGGIRQGREADINSRAKAPETAVLFVRTLLDQAATLRLLVTSRRRLGLAGEQVFPVPPLPVPDEPQEPDLLLRFAGIELFVHRAQAVNRAFRLTERNSRDVVALCRRLDGLPLALELAAGWAQTLTPRQMLDRFGRKFDLLVSPYVDGSARHKTLHTAMEWSCRLLSPALRFLFAQLSIFRGGWTLEAAEAICEISGPASGAFPYSVLEGLRELQAHSLIVAEENREDGESGDGVRFRLLETLREYASEQLTAEVHAALTRRHADFFVRLAEEADTYLLGQEQVLWLQRLTAEHDNLRAALQGCFETGAAETAVRLVGALHQFWRMRGHILEAREYLSRALEMPDASPRTKAHAKALAGAWMLAWHHGDLPAAYALMEEGLSIARAIGDRPGVASLLNNLGNLAFCQGDPARARALYRESVDIRQEIGDPLGSASPLNNLGEIAQYERDYRTAASLFQRTLAIYRDHGYDDGIARAFHNLGSVALAQERLKDAGPLFVESLQMRRRLGDRLGILETLEQLVLLARGQRRVRHSVTLWAAAAKLREELGDSPTPHEGSLNDGEIAAVRAELGDETFHSCWLQGEEMPLEQAISCAIEEQRSPTEV